MPKLVAEEVRSPLGRTVLEALIASRRLTIFEPSPQFLERARQAYLEVGGRGISDADLQLIATAIELSTRGKVIVLTDDYAVQNILGFLGIEHRPVSQRGITRVFKWVKICPACGSRYDDLRLSRCPKCGTELIAVPRRLRKREDSKGSETRRS